MKMENRLENEKKIIQKYLQQDVAIPDEVKGFLTDDKIMLYALSDLDEEYKFSNSWLVLTAKALKCICYVDGSYRVTNDIPLELIVKVKEVEGLSLITYVFISADDMPPLLTVRFTARQKIMMSNLKYVVSSLIDEKDETSFDSLDADSEYVKAMIKPLLEAKQAVADDKKSSALLRLLSYLLPYKKELVLGTLGAVLTTLFSLIPPYVSGYLIDKVVKPFQDGKLSLGEASTVAWILVGTLGAAFLLKEFFIWLRLKKMSFLGEYVARDIRSELYTHLQTLDMDYFSKKHTGSLISRVSSDTDRLWDFIAFGVVEVGIALISLVSLSVVLISMDLKLGLMMTLPVPILLFSIYVHGERMKKMFLNAWRKWSDLTSVLSDTIPGMQVVKAFNQEKKENKRFEDRNVSVTDEFFNIHRAWTSFWPLLMFGIQLVIFSVWVLSTPRLITVSGADDYLSAGTFVSFLLYMTMFAAPIEVIGQVARMLNRALSSAYRIFEVLDTRPSIKYVENPVKIDLKGKVEFKNVKFSYDGVRQIIKGLDFEVKPGEMIGLVGSSGGGKSTITKLMTRFYDIGSGKIKIDDVDLMNIDIGHFRKQVGMVLQEPYLFHGTIWENISYGLDDVDKIEVIKAAQVANAHDFITNLPHGYDTIIGERGHTLSGGERQRVSIARAILHDPKVLILDEATSAVDTETERKIQDALDKLVEGRTVFAIAHRLSTLRKADRIFVIGDGKVVEQGTHKELLSKTDGEYRKLHRMQQEMSEFFAL